MSAANDSASAAAVHGHEPHPWYLAHHFDSLEVQNHAVKLGMWLFLGTEVLLFAGLFVGYTVYRWLYHDAFKVGSGSLDLTMGTFNTVVLITSSFTVAWALHAIKENKFKLAKGLLIFTIGCACIFLVVKYFE